MHTNLPTFHTIGGRSIAISHDAADSIQVEGRRLTKAVHSAQGVTLYCGPDLYLVSTAVYREIAALPVVPYIEPDPEPWVQRMCSRCGALLIIEGDSGWVWDDAAQDWAHYCKRRR